jgi:heat shock protein HtpX
MFAFTIAMIFSILSSIGAYYNCDKIVLSMSNARPATMEQNQRMIENLEGLCIAADVPMPKLYVVEDSAPNAFATGRDPEHAVICVTTGLLDKLNDYELEGVLAHELSHIKNFDIRLQTVITVMVGFVTILADIFLRTGLRARRDSDNDSSSGLEVALTIVGVIFLVLSPIVGELIKLMLSRNREYLADSSAVELTRNPDGLINALLKISQDNEPLEVANKSTANLYICNPFKGEDATEFLNKIFATHPPIEDRINALRNIH